MAVYVKLLDAFDEHADELDVALFNRVGDLYAPAGQRRRRRRLLRAGGRPVRRHAASSTTPSRSATRSCATRRAARAIYYKLGKISAQKGFKSDAKVNFLEYADRMQKAGKVDEAFRALKEFADLCPDQDDIRLMLADQLTKAERKAEAIEQLQMLHERYDSEGRDAEATATADANARRSIRASSRAPAAATPEERQRAIWSSSISTHRAARRATAPRVARRRTPARHRRPGAAPRSRRDRAPTAEIAADQIVPSAADAPGVRRPHALETPVVEPRR